MVVAKKAVARIEDIKAMCVAIQGATLEDHTQACAGVPGKRGPLVAKFLFELCRWVAGSKKPLAEAHDLEWVSYSRADWINDTKVWGNKHKMKPAAFDRILKAARDTGALRTCQWPTQYTNWETALMSAPTAKHCEAVATHMRNRCEAVAKQVRNPDHYESPSSVQRHLPDGDAADADTPEGDKPLPASGEEQEHEARSARPLPANAGSPSNPPAPPSPATELQTAAAPKARELAKLWHGLCLEHHDIIHLPSTLKELGQLARLAKIIETDQPGTVRGFIASIIKRWGEFTIYAEQASGGAGGSPGLPNIDYLVKHINAAAQMLHDDDKEARQDAERVARREAERAAELAAQAQRDDWHAEQQVHREARWEATVGHLRVLAAERPHLSNDITALVEAVGAQVAKGWPHDAPKKPGTLAELRFIDMDDDPDAKAVLATLKGTNDDDVLEEAA